MPLICPDCKLILPSHVTLCECGNALDERNEQILSQGFWSSLRQLFFGSPVHSIPNQLAKKTISEGAIVLVLNSAGEVVSIRRGELEDQEVVEIEYDEQEEEPEANCLQGYSERTAVDDSLYPIESFPYNEPMLPMVIRGSRMVFTGIFEDGSIESNRLKAEQLGAKTTETVSRKTNYLVIGSKGHPNWSSSPYGGKIRLAKELRDAGSQIQIVSEQHWLGHLKA